mmetsp:Transcript_11096/g.44688  ORF Transcript_11096/g.44688 Transcript_11096/m.44688 type:complete len:231 (-) Transcript_11096:3538-4230(-)
MMISWKRSKGSAPRKERKKEDATLVWEWLGHMKSTRERWAKLFTRGVATRNTIMTNAAEALHSAIKHNSGMSRRLLEMILHIERRKDKLTRRKRNREALMEQVHDAQSQKSSVRLRHLRKKICPFAMEHCHLRASETKSFVCREYKTDEITEEVAEGVEEAPKKYLVFDPKKTPEKVAGIATTQSCSARCNTNMGLAVRSHAQGPREGGHGTSELGPHPSFLEREEVEGR